MKRHSRVGGSSQRQHVATAVIVLSLLACDVFPQSSPLKLMFAQDSTRSVPLRGIRQNNLLLASLNDIAHALSLSAKENLRDFAFEVRHREAEVRFFADNSFVAVAVKGKDTSACQLSSNVLHSAGMFYAPIGSVAMNFRPLFGVDATYDPSSNTLRVARARVVYDIVTLALEEKTNGSLLRIPAQRRFADCEAILKHDGWLYLTIPGAKGDLASLRKIPPGGVVKKMLSNQFPTSLQLALHLDESVVSAEIVREEGSDDIVVLLRNSRGVLAEEKGTREPNVDFDELRKRYELDVIVLDAGHGGKDPGTIGVRGTYEKNVTLPIVLKLGRLIEKYLKGVKVEYTRKDDRFIELDRRGQIANEMNGKLFISIHANSMPKKPHRRRGFEVYLLRPGRTDEAIAIAERENSVIELEEGYEQRYQKLTDENFILVTMAQAAHMKSSEMFAEYAAREMGKTIDTRNNGVAQAGFYVLVGASMPNVLIETAYLSNREDEALLRSNEGQQQYAEAIFSAIKKYKTEYERLLREGKDLGTRNPEAHNARRQ